MEQNQVGGWQIIGCYCTEIDGVHRIFFEENYDWMEKVFFFKFKKNNIRVRDM